MPTPFMHLEMAEAIKTAVSHSNQAYQQLANDLDTAWSAHYLGHIAPDFSYLAELKRFETHFYHPPLRVEDDIIANMLETYPSLKDVQTFSIEKRLFLGGYLAHLLYDMVWAKQIVIPYFFENEGMGDRQHRRLVHFLLLSWLDHEAYQSLSKEAEEWLMAAQPQNWLPFGSKETLITWQKLVTDQLGPNALTRTLEIFSERVELDVENFTAYFQDVEWMDTHVHNLLPLPEFEKIKAQTVQNSIELLLTYLYR